MADGGTHLNLEDRPSRYVMPKRQRLEKDLIDAGAQFVQTSPCGVVAANDTKSDLTASAQKLAAWLKAHAPQFRRSDAAAPAYDTAMDYLPALLRDTAMDGLTEDAAGVFAAAFDLEFDTLGEGLTPDAARVLVAAVKREVS